MIYSEKKFTPTPTYPTYPPYHQGFYLEDYFINRFINDLPKTHRHFIGISWTTLYCTNNTGGLQEYLDSLPHEQKYFTVSQHDDAPNHRLPPNTICFSAGGRIKNANTVPIPLICSKLHLPYQFNLNLPRQILASFVGSNTHPIRNSLYETYKNSQNIKIFLKGWSPQVNLNEFQLFLQTAMNSKFCLCPRGYGLNSFRLYESMQLGCIPVIITDDFYLPWQDELDWEEFSVLISTDQVSEIEKILLTYTDDKISQMRKAIKNNYTKYFTLDGLYDNILKRVAVL
jgi:hypothetical protein